MSALTREILLLFISSPASSNEGPEIDKMKDLYIIFNFIDWLHKWLLATLMILCILITFKEIHGLFQNM